MRGVTELMGVPTSENPAFVRGQHSLEGVFKRGNAVYKCDLWGCSHAII